MPVQMRVRLHRACIVHMRMRADQFGALQQRGDERGEEENGIRWRSSCGYRSRSPCRCR